MVEREDQEQDTERPSMTSAEFLDWLSRKMGMTDRINIVELECFQANQIIYQANGKTDDGRHVYIRYRSGTYSIGVGDTDYEAVFDNTLVVECDLDPLSINVETHRKLACHKFTFPDTYDGFNGGKT